MQKFSFNQERYKRREIIEALRLGVVPTQYVDKFTYGREKEISKILNWLRRSKGSFYIVGPYGSGKTHLLNYVFKLGLKLGYAVCIAELDPNETPPYNPRMVYKCLTRTFRWMFRGEQRHFRDFLEKLSTLPLSKLRHLRDHIYLYPVVRRLGYLVSPFKRELTLRWIEGSINGYSFRPPLYPHTTATNIYCNILSGLGYAAKMILNLKGLLIILDEAESVTSSWFYTYQKQRSINFIKGLELLASNNDRLMEDYVDYSEDYNSYVGHATGLIYHGYAPNVKYAYKIPSYVKVIIAITGSEIPDSNDNVLPLRPLAEDAKLKIVNAIYNNYRVAYGIAEKKKIIPGIYGKIRNIRSIRRFIKGAIEIFDYIRFYNDYTLKEIL